MARYILAVDQGTTNTKAVLIDRAGSIVEVSEGFPVTPSRPRTGWVEFDPREIYDGVVAAIRSVLRIARIDGSKIHAAGLANQGETVIPFDTRSGKPLYPAISWQDNRGADLVRRWSADLDSINRRTGLFPHSYFSAVKMRWLLDNIPGVREAAEDDSLCLATSDTWLLNRLSPDGPRDRPLVTDVSTASRTLLFNLSRMMWDEGLCESFGIPLRLLPNVVPNTTVIGSLDEHICGCEIPVAGLCVDQPAALFGEGCIDPGSTKITCGTGCFILAHAGDNDRIRVPGILTSVGWAGVTGASAPAFVLDGGIHNAGSVFRWIIDDLGLADSDREIDEAIGSADRDAPYFVPALQGLAAPHWRSDLSGAWIGMRSCHGRRDLLRAAAESISFRIREVIEAMERGGALISSIRVDGGLSNSAPLMQMTADVLGRGIDIFNGAEATARGVGLFAGLGTSFFDMDQIHQYTADSTHIAPNPEMRRRHDMRYERWQVLVGRYAEAMSDEPDKK